MCALDQIRQYKKSSDRPAAILDCFEDRLRRWETSLRTPTHLPSNGKCYENSHESYLILIYSCNNNSYNPQQYQ